MSDNSSESAIFRKTDSLQISETDKNGISDSVICNMGKYATTLVLWIFRRIFYDLYTSLFVDIRTLDNL